MTKRRLRDSRGTAEDVSLNEYEKGLSYTCFTQPRALQRRVDRGFRRSLQRSHQRQANHAAAAPPSIKHIPDHLLLGLFPFAHEGRDLLDLLVAQVMGAVSVDAAEAEGFADTG